nr:hypothetical protein [Tanacetum cinerariifolium]
MSSTFADTHNMIAILNKSAASEGFDQIIDFLNVRYIQYALTVNPHIYVSCIKQFWNIVTVKQSNDVTRGNRLPAKRRNFYWIGSNEVGVKTPLFEGMLVAGEIQEQGDEEELVQDDIDDAVAQGADTAIEEDAAPELSIPSPTPPTSLPQQSHDLPSTSQVQHTPPQSPLPQSQPPPQAYPQAAD